MVKYFATLLALKSEWDSKIIFVFPNREVIIIHFSVKDQICCTLVSWKLGGIPLLSVVSETISAFWCFWKICFFFSSFFYVGFPSRIFTIHWTAGEGGGYIYHIHPLHRHLKTLINRMVTVKSPSLHIGSSRTQTRNLWFPSVSR